jgi:membrane protease YdiL (CAAX protease family)
MNQDLLAIIPFALLLLAVLGLWIHRVAWFAALTAAIVAAYFTGALQDTAILWIALLAAAAWMYRWRKSSASSSRAQRLIAAVAFSLMALAMGLALLPGFPRVILVEDLVLSPGAMPYTLGLGFPKVVGGILILGIIHQERVRSWREFGAVLRRAAPIYAVTAILVMLLTLGLGYVKFDPKWSLLFLVWAPVNLFFTCLAEEAFFRGFLLRELSEIGANRQRALAIAFGVSAILFGMVHLAGGWKYALAATIAGLGYGWAYHRTQRVEAGMAVHFALNATHFLLFTYPALA